MSGIRTIVPLLARMVVRKSEKRENEPMANTFTKEHVIKVWDDSNGTHVYVGPDADGLELVELRYIDEDGEIGDRITMPSEQAVKVAEAILELYGNRG